MAFYCKKVIHFFLKGVTGVIFPNVCICCGVETTEKERQICTFCLLERFVDANPENTFSSAGVLLPDGIFAQHALWNFDKGGALQDLLHLLKYEHLNRIGIQLGEQLALRIKKHQNLYSLIREKDIILVPVPLHYLKFMRRGFNQAFMIARGLQNIFNFQICRSKDLCRTKNTRSQTGLDLQKRRANIEGAFIVKDPAVFKSRFALVVDDVFTTGATTFELSKKLLQTGAEGVIILTVAQA